MLHYCQIGCVGSAAEIPLPMPGRRRSPVCRHERARRLPLTPRQGWRLVARREMGDAAAAWLSIQASRHHLEMPRRLHAASSISAIIIHRHLPFITLRFRQRFLMLP